MQLVQYFQWLCYIGVDRTLEKQCCSRTEFKNLFIDIAIRNRYTYSDAGINHKAVQHPKCVSEGMDLGGRPFTEAVHR
ncbi:MAG: hypothetical protein QW406_06895 [Ignisphaera sp.]